MGSKRDNLVCDANKFHRRTHYHDRSYHRRSDYFDARTTSGDESGNVALYVYAGERSAAAEPRCNVSGAKIDRIIRRCHAQGLGSFWERRMANASHLGIVVRTRHRAAWLARTSL